MDQLQIEPGFPVHTLYAVARPAAPVNIVLEYTHAERMSQLIMIHLKTANEATHRFE